MPQNLRERAIGMLNAGMTMNANGMNTVWSTSAISHLRQRFKATGRTEGRHVVDVHASGRVPKTGIFGTPIRAIASKLTQPRLLSHLVLITTFKPLAPHHCGFESRLGLWILSCEEAIQLAYRTSVVLLGYPFVHCTWNNSRKGTRGLPPPVKLERRHMTSTVLVWRQTQ
jgi:hypothetical protein